MKTLNSRLIGLAVAGVLATGSIAFAATRSFDVIDVKVGEIFVPVGFDDNDEVVVVVDGFLPNSCYKLDAAKYEVGLESPVIKITQTARRYPGPCGVMAIVPFSNTVSIGLLPHAKYDVVANEGSLVRKLEVTESTNAGPDDELYAPVQQLSVHRIPDTGDMYALLEVNLSNSCMSLKQPIIEDHGRTLEVRPVMTMSGTNCKEQENLISLPVSLPPREGGRRYLLHVRSLNGQSLNQVFTVPRTGDPIGGF